MPKHARPAPDERAEPTFLRSTLDVAKSPVTTRISEMWIGFEPTFSSRKTVKRWTSLAVDAEGELAFFSDPWILRKQGKIARRIRDRFREAVEAGDRACLFDAVGLSSGEDPWGAPRRELEFRWSDGEFEVKLGLDPETFEYSLKPVPLTWLYEPRFINFLQRFVWDVSERSGLRPSMLHGGGQFSLSAKTFLVGSLLADDVACRLNHPELSTWILDFPNPDDRAFRATSARKAAFERLLGAYWDGAFHPDTIGTPTVGDVLLERGFAPSAIARKRMDRRRGPIGSAEEVFRTNFAFARAMFSRAQSVDPGYWQSGNPDEPGFRPEQLPRYSEANAHRIQIAGERHVKSGEVLCEDRIPAFDAPLDPSHLYDEASFEIRAQMGRTSARDFVDAVLLDVHHAAWLLEHPGVQIRASLLQDQLHGDAEALIGRRDPGRLGDLKAAAAKANAEASGGRIRSDRVEPEDLFWAAWTAASAPERAAIAAEAVTGFVERVENAASCDPRRSDDPMEPHRHRVHPVLWDALGADVGAMSAAVRREWQIAVDRRVELHARRPRWSVVGSRPPWKTG